MKFFQDNQVLILLMLIPLTAYLVYYFLKKRDGFQNPGKTSNTPASCTIIKSVIEQINENLKKAKESNDMTLVKNIETSLSSINEQMKKMGC